MDKFLSDNILYIFFDSSISFKDVKTSVLIDFTQPLLMEINYLNDLYLAYCLQDHTIETNNGIAYIREIFLVKTNDIIINDLKNNSVTIYEALSYSDEKWRIGSINNKKYPAKEVNSLVEIKDMIPKDFVKLKDIPNKIKF